LRTLKPKTFIFENVAGFAYKVHPEGYALLRRTAERLGYSIASGVLNAADYGVPQIRERFIMLGRLKGSIDLPPPTHRSPDEQHDPLELFPDDRVLWRTAGDVLCDLDTEENASDEGHFAGGKHHDLLKQVPPGDNYLYFTAERGHPNPVFRWRSRYWSFLLKLSPNKPSWTIQARRSNNMGPFHWRNRILRISEVKRLQTFPDDWHIAGTTEQQWRQVGNAIPPMLAEVLGRHLLRACKPARARQ
jgi:DNA (cytosine-5)-methyltransferase 1